jgi:uncharacterized protein
MSIVKSSKVATLAAVAAASLMASAAIAAEFEKRAVSFKVEGQTLRGDLYLPKGAKAGANLPAVVVGGSLTSVKEQMSGSYAKELASRGIAALAFDYRHYGQSEGQPRQLESVEAKKADLKGAVSFLQTQAAINPNGISLLGVCTSGGNVIQAAAEDGRVKAVVTIAGWFAEPSLTPLLYGGEAGVAGLKAQGQQALAKFRSTGVSDAVKTYGMQAQAQRMRATIWTITSTPSAATSLSGRMPSLCNLGNHGSASILWRRQAKSKRPP